ncbi:hypothetical protein ABKA04_005651 [Annulohypoxylon sp. FPYF3050]
MLREPCVHLFPSIIEQLRPIEEKFLAIGIAYAIITKFTLDPMTNHPSSPAYRKITSHVSVFVNDIHAVAKILPQNIEDVLGDIHVVWCGPGKPKEEDLMPWLGLRKNIMMFALDWLIEYNHLYFNVKKNPKFFEMWKGKEEIIPPQLWATITHIKDSEAESAERATYVPRHDIRDPILGEEIPEESIASNSNENNDNGLLSVNNDDENELGEDIYADDDINDEDWEEAFRQLEESSNTILQHEPPKTLLNEDDGELHPPIVSSTTSSGFFRLDTDQADDAQKTCFLQQSMNSESGQHQNDGEASDEDGPHISAESINGQPYVRVQRGNRYLSIRDPYYFESIFIKLFPYGVGGPFATNSDQRRELEKNGEKNFSIQTWASIKLRQHGAAAATHPIFPFLVFDRIIKNNSSRISSAQAKKSSFPDLQEIINKISPDELLEAANELKNNKPISSERMNKLMKEITIYGRQQPLSNESRIKQRDQIRSLIVQHGPPGIWFTINPNDLSSPVRIKIGRKFRSCRYLKEIERRLQQHLLDKRKSMVKEVNQDPVSAVIWFHLHVSSFFNEIVRAKTKDGAFGPINQYFGAIETNGRGAFHLHGFLWYHGNIGQEKYYPELVAKLDATDVAELLQYVDMHFKESFDQVSSKERSRIADRKEPSPSLKRNLDSLTAEWEDEANFVATAAQAHKCTATCFKYKRTKTGKKDGKQQKPCRFGWPWDLVDETHIDDNGVLRIGRNCINCTRYNPVISAALRHNHDFCLIFTMVQAMALIFYTTNYATKMEAPMYQRLAMVYMHYEAITKLPEFVNSENAAEVIRSFMTKISNRIFSDREFSSVDVCNYILGHDTFYSSQKNWAWIHCTTVYYAILRQWSYLRKLATGDLNDAQPASEPTMSFQKVGIKPSMFEAYINRGEAFEDVCFYDYVSIVKVVPKPKQAARTKSHVDFEGELYSGNFCQLILSKSERCTPLLTGAYPLDFNDDNLYGRTAVIRMALFIPWEKFLTISNGSIMEIWERLSATLPERLDFIQSNFNVLRQSREDGILNAKIWNTQISQDPGELDSSIQNDNQVNDGEIAEDDEESKERQEAEELVAFSESLNKSLLQSLLTGTPVFENAINRLAQSFSTGRAIRLPDFPIAPELDQYRRIENDIDFVIANSRTKGKARNVIDVTIKEWKQQLNRLNTLKSRQIAGEGHDQNEANLGNQDQDEELLGMNEDPVVLRTERTISDQSSWTDKPTTLSVDYYIGQTWSEASNILSMKEGLNANQATSLGIILRHLDQVDIAKASQANDMVGAPTPQLLHYLGGEGGTGKSVVIKTLLKALETKDMRRRIQITATSGSAGAHIDGVTIHSAYDVW